MTTPPDQPPDPDRGLTPRNLRTAAIAGGVSLVAGMFTLVMCSGGGDGDKEPAAAPRATVTVTASARPGPASAAPVPGPSASSSSPAPSKAPPPRVVWRGTLRVNGPHALEDLDQTPPRVSESSGAADIRGDWLQTMLKAMSDARIAVLPPGGRSGASQCRDAALASGEAVTDRLRTGDVVCVVTAPGRVVRLVTQYATQTSRAPELAFAVTMWDVPGTPQ